MVGPVVMYLYLSGGVPLNNIVVFDRLSVKSWAGQEILDVPTYQCKDISEALRVESPGELLFVAYGRVSGLPLPRLNKAAMARFAFDEDIRLTTILVDVDYEDHQEPPPEWHSDLLSALPFPAGWYRTPHGLRLLWRLPESLPLAYADSAIAWVHQQLLAAGIQTDVGTQDWTRFQRAPHAFHRDLPHCDFDDIPTIDIPEDALEVGTARGLGTIVDCDQPSSIDKLTRSDVSPIKAWDATVADALYRGEWSAPIGSRHAEMLSLAMVISFLCESNDPRVPYRILSPSVEKMEDKDLAELWRVCEWTAAAFDASQKEDQKEILEAKIRAAKDLGCAVTDVRQRVILDSGKDYFVWDEAEKCYSQPYLNQRQLLAALKLHAPLLAGEVLWAKEPTADILRDFSSPVNRIIYSYTAERSQYIPERREVVIPCVAVDRTLKPRHNEHVAKWLEAFFGPDHLQHGLDWLAAAPRLDRPVCALYIRGTNSIGKGMLASGIARLWSPYKEFTPYGEVASDFQKTLLHTPLIVADEKVPQRAFVPNDSSIFRRVVGNGVHSLNPKNQHPVTLLGFPRVLITANNEDALSIREDLDQDDLDAVTLRVGYINREGDASARKVLEELAAENGFASTYDMTLPWVNRGIAEHILWLQENRQISPGPRFLVQGWESEFTEGLVTKAGSSGTVAETLVLAVESGVYTDAVRWFEGTVYVNAQGLAKEWKILRGHDVDAPPSSNSRLKALRSLAGGTQRTLRTKGGSQRRYWAIDAEVLARLAEDRNLADYQIILDAAARDRDAEEFAQNNLMNNLNM